MCEGTEAVERWLETGAASRRTAPLGRCRVTGPIYRGRHSTLFAAHCSGVPVPAVVKVCRDPRTGAPDEEGAVEQYSALERVAERWPPGTPHHCPRPFALYADRAMLVMERVDGPSLTRRLSAWRTGPAEADRLLHSAGAWLATFHHAHSSPPAPLELSRKAVVVDGMADWPAAVLPGFRRAAEILARTLPVAKASPVAGSWVHGDFKADNVIAGPRGPVGIDYLLRHRDAVVYDMGSFLNHLDLSALDPRNLRVAAARRRWAGRFLDGYAAATEEAVPVVALAWTRLYQLLHLWNSAVGASRGVSLRRWLLGRAFETVAGELGGVLAGGPVDDVALRDSSRRAG